MKKILYFITQSDMGGAQRYVFDLADNLKDDYEVAIAFGEQGDGGEYVKILKKAEINYFILPHLKRSISPFNEILALLEIIKLINNFKPNIIHLNSSKISILGSLAGYILKLKITNALAGPRFCGKNLKIIYTAHGWVFNEPLPWRLKTFYKWAERLTAYLKNKIICVSEYDRQNALNKKIAPPEKLITIHNGLAPINFYSKEEARKQLSSEIGNFKPDSPLAGFPISNIIIGSIGNLYKTKGFEYFIKAASLLIKDNKLPLTFIIIGEGKERKNLEKLIKDNNLADNFILAGRINYAARLLPGFDIFVCSSVKEGFPYSILEAMAAGLPIIATNVCGIPEMIIDKKTGSLVKAADTIDLTDKIKQLIADKQLGKNLAKQAQEEVKNNFRLNKMIELTKSVYSNL